MVNGGIGALWNFTPYKIKVDENIVVQESGSSVMFAVYDATGLALGVNSIDFAYISPNVFKVDTSNTLERLKRQVLSPPGIPNRKISFISSLYNLKCFLSNLTLPTPLNNTRSERKAVIPLDATVAIATPATSIFNTTTKNTFSTILAKPPIMRKIKGLTVSPTARIIAALKL